MKYTVEGLSQEGLLDLGLDCIDAVILRYVVDFYSTGKMVKIQIDEKEYFWLKYQSVIEQIPIIGITSKIALARRFDKYVECGLMEKVLYKNAGNYTCFRLTEIYEGLVSRGGVLTQKYKGYKPKSIKGINSKVKTKDSSSRDSSTSNTSVQKDARVKHLIDYYFDKYKAKTGRKPNVTGAWGKGFQRLLANSTEDEIRKVVDFFFAYKDRTQFAFTAFFGKYDNLAPLALKGKSELRGSRYPTYECECGYRWKSTSSFCMRCGKEGRKV